MTVCGPVTWPQMLGGKAFGEYVLKQWQQAGSLKTSVLKPLIATLEQTQIIKVLGSLAVRDWQGLKGALQTILAESA